jgi:hypothetical protein
MSGNLSGDFSPLPQPTTGVYLVNVLLTKGQSPHVIRDFLPDTSNGSHTPPLLITQWFQYWNH